MGFIGLAVYSLLKSVCCCSTDVHPDVSALTHHRQTPACWQHAWKSQEPTNRVDEDELQCPKYTRARFPDVIFLFKFSSSFESPSSFWASLCNILSKHQTSWRLNIPLQTMRKTNQTNNKKINPRRFRVLQETGQSFSLLGILLDGKLAKGPFLIKWNLKMALL